MTSRRGPSDARCSRSRDTPSALGWLRWLAASPAVPCKVTRGTVADGIAVRRAPPFVKDTGQRRISPAERSRPPPTVLMRPAGELISALGALYIYLIRSEGSNGIAPSLSTPSAVAADISIASVVPDSRRSRRSSAHNLMNTHVYSVIRVIKPCWLRARVTVLSPGLESSRRRGFFILERPVSTTKECGRPETGKLLDLVYCGQSWL